MKKKLSFISTLLVTCAMNAQVDSNADQKVKNLYGNLKEVAWDTKSIIFGQEFYNSYSYPKNLNGGGNTSDVYNVTKKKPGLLGQDFAYYNPAYGDNYIKNHRDGALQAYRDGNVLEFCFHMNSKNHSNSYDYQSSDRYLMYNIGEQNNQYKELDWIKGQLDVAINVMNNQIKAPVIFRLFHEMNGNWFWWGTNAYGGATSYKKMYQFCVNYIKARTNYALFAWSPNYPFTGGNNPGINYYPGDNYVDVVGLDMYDQGTSSGQSFDTMVSQLTAVSDFSSQHNKIPVFAEVGNRVSRDPYWWYNMNDKIRKSNRAFKIAYMMTWINQDWKNDGAVLPYVPFNGSTGDQKKGFISFTENGILMQQDVKNRNMYDNSYRTSKMGPENKKSITENEDGEIIAASKVSVYPNPVVADYFNIDLGNSANKDATITVTDLTGQIMFIKNTREEQLIEIPVTALSNGVYLVSIVSEDLNETHKIIVQ